MISRPLIIISEDCNLHIERILLLQRISLRNWVRKANGIIKPELDHSLYLSPRLHRAILLERCQAYAQVERDEK